MLTVLSLNNEKEKLNLKKLRNSLGSRIYYDEKRLGGVKYLNVTIKKNKISWKKLMKKLNGKTKDILCPKEISLPNKYGFSRFESNLLQREFCKNAAVNVLKMSNIDPQKLKISIFDPKGANGDFLEKILPFSCNINVITKKYDNYIDIQDKLMNEYGVSIIVTDNFNWASKSHLIIAFGRINSVMPMQSTAVGMTSDKSNVNLKGIIYNKYKVDIPKYLNEFIPQKLEAEYFLSALYEKCNIKSLSKLVPTYCLSNDKITSIEKISAYLKSIV